MKTIIGNNLPEITEVTLLSLEEFEECQKHVNFCDLIPDDECSSWYLRTPADDGEIWTVIYGDEIDEPYPVDFEDYPPEGSWGTALRPIIKLSSSVLKDGTILEIGDNVVIGKNSFTAISDTILFSDKAAWYDEANDTYGYFDDETNAYENSLAKKRVDAWFDAKIKPNL